MSSRDDLLRCLDAELDPGRFSDYGPNGLQVTGADEVALVATAVSATLEAFEGAAAAGAQLLLVHHGLFVFGAPPLVDPLLRRRLAVLFEHDIALAGYHLPLDAHPTLGNNALLAAALGARPERWFLPTRGAPIALAARLREPLRSTALAAAVERVTGRPPLVLQGGPEPIRTLGICSGGAGGGVVEAAALGLDAYLTGEPEEASRALASELSITFLAGGHHATERLGIQALGDLLHERFGVATRFVDVDNPV